MAKQIDFYFNFMYRYWRLSLVMKFNKSEITHLNFELDIEVLEKKISAE